MNRLIIAILLTSGLLTSGPDSYASHTVEVEGMTCVVIDGYNSLGISCNWDEYKKQLTARSCHWRGRIFW